MAMMKIRCILQGRYKLAEGPVWCDRSQSLWWVNMVEPAAVYCLRWGTEEPRIYPAPTPVTGLALTEDGLAIVGSVGGLLRLDPDIGSFDMVLRLEEDRPDNRCNELGVDPQGNLWVGTMTNNLSGRTVEAGAGSLFRVSPERRVERMLQGVGIPNTLLWSEDSTRLFTADSHSGVMSVIDIDPTNGAISNVRPLHQSDDCGVPDGSAMSKDGTLWNARWSAGCLLGIRPDGTERGRIAVPGGNITSACFAGPNLDVLAVTTSLWGLDDDDVASNLDLGGVFVIEGLDVGRPTKRYLGQVGNWVAL